MKRIVLNIFALALIMFVACAHTHPSQNQIITAAKACASKAGYHVEDYSIEVEVQSDNEVFVYFIGKAMLPGTHFLVCVEPNTLNCKLFHGM